jgi:hypothetical protein
LVVTSNKSCLVVLYAASNETINNKKIKSNDSHSGQTARLENTIRSLHQERTKIKDFITEINRLENLVNYNDTKLLNVLGLMMKCDEASPYYTKLESMYEEATTIKHATNVTLQLKKFSYDEYLASLAVNDTAPKVISLKQAENVSVLGNDGVATIVLDNSEQINENGGEELSDEDDDNNESDSDSDSE